MNCEPPSAVNASSRTITASTSASSTSCGNVFWNGDTLNAACTWPVGPSEQVVERNRALVRVVGGGCPDEERMRTAGSPSDLPRCASFRSRAPCRAHGEHIAASFPGPSPICTVVLHSSMCSGRDEASPHDPSSLADVSRSLDRCMFRGADDDVRNPQSAAQVPSWTAADASFGFLAHPGCPRRPIDTGRTAEGTLPAIPLTSRPCVACFPCSCSSGWRCPGPGPAAEVEYMVPEGAAATLPFACRWLAASCISAATSCRRRRRAPSAAASKRRPRPSPTSSGCWRPTVASMNRWWSPCWGDILADVGESARISTRSMWPSPDP